MTLLLAIVAGALIGLSLGALGGGGSILAVPVLVYLLGQDAAQATTGSLVVVGVTSLIGAVTAHRAGNVMLARGVTFGIVAIGGAAAGAKASAHVADSVLLAAFAALMLLVGGLMAIRQLRHARQSRQPRRSDESQPDRARPADLDDPIIAFREGFMCDCPRAVKVLVTATAGRPAHRVPRCRRRLPRRPRARPRARTADDLRRRHLTGGHHPDQRRRPGVRAGVGTTPDWTLVAALTAASAAGGFAGARLADRIDTTKLSTAFTVLVLGVAAYTATQALPALL